MYSYTARYVPLRLGFNSSALTLHFILNFISLRFNWAVSVGGMLLTLAGTGQAGSADGIANNASFTYPWSELGFIPLQAISRSCRLLFNAVVSLFSFAGEW